MSFLFRLLSGSVLFCSLSILSAQDSAIEIPDSIRHKARMAHEFFEMPGSRPQAFEMMRATIAEAEAVTGRGNPNISELHNSLSVMYQYEERFSEGLSAAQRAVLNAIGFADENNIQLLRAKISMGRCLLNLGQIEKAISAYEDAVRGFTVLGDEEGLMNALVLQGAGLNELGAYQDAERVFLKALELKRASPSVTPRTLIQILSTTGKFYAELGSFERALHYQSEALKVGQTTYGTNDPGLLSLITGVIRTLMKIQDYEAANSLIGRARQIVNASSGAISGPSASLSGLEGALAAETGSFEEAFQKIAFLHQFQGGGSRTYPGMERILNNLGYLSVLSDDLEAAESFLSKSEELATALEGENSDFTANLSYNFAILAAAKQLPDEAAERIKKAVEIYETLIPAISALSSDQQKLAFFQRLSGKTNFSINLSQNLFPDHDGIRQAALLTILQRKGRAADLSRIYSSTKTGDATFAKRQQLLTQIAKIGLGEVNLPAGAAMHRSWNLQKELEALDRESRKGPAVLSRKATIENISEQIGDTETLIEFVVYQPVDPKLPKSKHGEIPHHCAAYLLDSEGKVQAIDLGLMSTIESQIRSIRKDLQNPGSHDYTADAQALYERIILPIAKLTKGKNHWLVSPDGSLNLIPFEVLMDKEEGYLIDKISLTYLSSGRDLISEPVEGKANSAVVFAGPDYDAADSAGPTDSMVTGNRFQMNFSPLPGALEEGKALAKLMPNATAKFQKEATETAIKAASDPLILHIATHGFFLSDEPDFEGTRGLKRKKVSPPPSQTTGTSRVSFFTVDSPLNRSGLAFAGANHKRSGDEDGILTALEVTGLDLNRTKLVVLSACETGLGEVITGEGIYGLRRAFQLAGAESQVLSLWKVSDQATKQLMIDFYSNIRKGDGRSESLRLAKQKLKSDPKFAHPAYWSAFIFSGEHGKLIP